MKKAFLHDWIINFWWAESILIDLIEKFSWNDIIKVFTVFSTYKSLKVEWKNIEIIPLISNGFIINKIWYRNLMPFFSIFTYFLRKKVEKYNPDEIYISSFAIAKNIIDKRHSILSNTAIKLYLHSPMEYIWNSFDDYLNKFKWLKKYIYFFVSKYLRKRDLKYSDYDLIWCNSLYTKKLTEKIYFNWENKNIKIKYPSIDKIFIETDVSISHWYYLYVWRLVKFLKEVDKIINLFNKINKKLLIIWDWPDKYYLKSLVKNDNIVFLNYIGNKFELVDIMKHADWIVNIWKESFGITTAESLSLWVPVFWYRYSASEELIEHKKTWFLVENKSDKVLFEQFKKFTEFERDRKNIKKIFLEKYKKNIKSY